MRLKSYISENRDLRIAETISRECSDILSISRHSPSKNTLVLFRGSKKPLLNGAQRYTPRQDRRPTDMPTEIHEMYDKLFYEKFGWHARSEGVFACGGERMSYGKNAFFFPANGFKFVWSPKIFDVYTSMYKTKEHVEEGFDSYIDADLERAIHSHKEIIFKCDFYWRVSMDDHLEIIHEIGKLNKNEHFIDFTPR